MDRHVIKPAYRPVTSYDLGLAVLLSRLNDVPLQHVATK